MTMNMADKRGRFLKKVVIGAVVGAAFGYFALSGVSKAFGDGVLDALNRSQGIALTLALIYIAMAVFIGLSLIKPSVGAQLLNVADVEDLTDQRRMLAFSSIGVLALGIALALAALGAPSGPIDATIVIVGFVVLMLVAIFASILQMRHMDELMLALSRASAAMSFYLVGTIGGTWALLAHLDRVAAPMPLDWLTMFAGLTLVGSVIEAGKRGLLKQP